MTIKELAAKNLAKITHFQTRKWTIKPLETQKKFLKN